MSNTILANTSTMENDLSSAFSTTELNKNKEYIMTNQQVQIVEYNHNYAQAVADMWNCSKDGWNGELDHKTAKSVKQKEEISSHLNLYLALDGDKVIGYCKLSKYFADENTLYIDLLNVDPAYHGKKAGKLLVKKSVERTIELGYPRLDLFTWAGNTKAVPLYKKCGFFWEKMESGSTHLMNFIPAVLDTELFKDYFSEACWYDDSNRVIEVEPDGRTENGFDYLAYSWHKNGKNLLVEFEKSGRGISKIETDDYAISAIAPHNRLVFGKNYKISYEIINKSNTPLEIQITGETNKNITCKADYTGNIADRFIYEADFYLDKITKEQSIWQTHPVVISNIIVNGKKAVLKTGIKPQFPLKFTSHHNYYLQHAGQPFDFIADVENNFDEDCTFEINFPKLPDVQFMGNSKTISLKKAERNMFTVKAIIHNSVMINQDIEIKATFANGETLTFQQKMRWTQNTYDGKLYGESDYYHYMSYGKFSFSLEKHMEFNEMVFRSIVSDIWSFIGAPKIGKPFSSEFTKKAPYKTEFSETHNAMLLKCFYQSDDFAGCEFAQSFKMFRSGMLEHWYEVISFPDGVEEFQLSSEINMERNKITMPYSGKLIKFDQILNNDTALDLLNSENLTENWLFSEKEKSTVAFIWPKEYKLAFCSWYFAIEHSFTKSGKLTTEPTIFAIDMFESVKKLREFALRKEVEEEQIFDSFDLEINEGNPFSAKKVTGAFADYKEKPLDAAIQISSVQNPYLKLEQKNMREDKQHRVNFDFEFEGNNPLELITCKADYYSKEFNKTKAVFVKSEGLVVVSEQTSNDLNILSAQNGVIQIKSSPEFAPSVFSLTYKGKEWLDSDFPNKPCKSWWNPWYGGITNKPNGMKEHFYVAEKTTAGFVKKTDKKGNIWEGIEIVTKIEKYDLLKGITIKQHFLMMPNLPVLVSFVEVTNNAGFYKGFDYLAGQMFVKPENELADFTIKTSDANRENIIKCGYESIEQESNKKLLSYESKVRNEKLYAYNSALDSFLSVSTDSHIITSYFYEHRVIKNGETKVFPPKFIIFSESDLTEENLVDLQNIRFE